MVTTCSFRMSKEEKKKRKKIMDTDNSGVTSQEREEVWGINGDKRKCDVGVGNIQYSVQMMRCEIVPLKTV